MSVQMQQLAAADSVGLVLAELPVSVRLLPEVTELRIR
jgi:hypothetical protein